MDQTSYRVHGSAIFDDKTFFPIQISVSAPSEEQAVERALSAMKGLSRLDSFHEVIAIEEREAIKEGEYGETQKGKYESILGSIATNEADYRYFPAHARYFFVYGGNLNGLDIEIQSNSVPDDEAGSFEAAQILMPEVKDFTRIGTGEFEMWTQEAMDGWAKAYAEGLVNGSWEEDDLPF